MKQPQQPPVQTVGPSPLPMSAAVGQTQLKSDNQVVLQIDTPQGRSVFFFEPDGAIALAERLKEKAEAAKSGLVLPVQPSGLIV